MVMQVRRTLTVGAIPTGLAEGQISVGMADEPPTAWVGVPASVNPAGVIPITGLVRTVAGAPQPAGSLGQLWWDEDAAQLFVYTGNEWVVAVNWPGGSSVSFPASPAPNQLVTDAATNTTWRWDAPTTRWLATTAGAAFLPMSGGTMTGPLILDGPATDPDGAVTLGQLEPAFEAGGRNVLHNPWFEINQRGAGTVSGIDGVTAAFPVDRWGLFVQGGGSVTAAAAQIGDAGRQQIGNEQALMRLDLAPTGAANGSSWLSQRIEKVRRLAGKPVVVSFYAVTDTAGARIGVSLAQVFGTGGTPSPGVGQPGQAVTLTTTWTRYALNFTFPTVDGKVFGTNGDDFSSLTFWASAGPTSPNYAASDNLGAQTGVTLRLWGVQLEIGDNATPLEPTDPQQDAAKCYRFYFASGRTRPMAAVTGAGMNGWIPVSVDFPVVMRAIPTVVLALGGVGLGGYGQVAAPTESGMYVYANVTGVTGNMTSFTFTATAEL